MPLLHKKPFNPNKHPPDLKENEEVFFCRLTLEIFRDYEEFCERVILCNSLVWSCSLTGRSHLTYQEAAASEEKVKRLLKRFPMELRIPVLYLSSLCDRRSLVELAEDVYSFVKDRYFIGETVEVNLSDGQSEPVKCHVLAVNPPNKEEIEKYEEKIVKNGERYPWVPAPLYRYEVERMDTSEEAEVSGVLISRKKSSYTKDKNRLYIKQFVHLENGFWRLKESSNMKYGISKVKFEQIFCGAAPEMNVLKSNNGIEKKKGSVGKKQETINKYFKSSDKKYNIAPKKSPKKSGEFLERRNGGVIRKRRTKKEMEEAHRLGNKFGPKYKSSSVEAKQKEKLEKREKKKNLAEFLKEWNLKREDLECEDLKDLPVPTPVNSKLSNERFGDAVMIMEFLFSFRNILPVKDFFPNGVTFDLVERALIDNEISGPLSDLVHLLLQGIFDLLEQEAEETKDTDVKITPGLVFTRGDADMVSVVKAATVSESWIRKHHSLPLCQLTVDPTTLTEVLRLHFLSSGAAPAKSKTAKWRYQARGGYCNNDDPGVLFKLRKPQIIEKLGQSNICDFSIDEKVSIINCLMEQILTYSTPRDIVEEGCDKARSARIELRSVRAAEVRKGKEEAMRLKAVKKGVEPMLKEKESEKSADAVARELRSGQGAPGKRDLPEILKEIRKALAGAQLAPLGTDRAYRRFWIFSSIPGLFVEEGDDEPGSCLPNGTPYFPSDGEGEEDHLAYIRRLFEESSKDKENVPDRGPLQRLMSPGKRQHLGEKNGDENHLNPEEEDKNHELERSRLICSGDYETCYVHGKSRSKRWSFFDDPSQIDQLINSLNRRGIREKKLRQALIQERDVIITRLATCPADNINQLVSNGAKIFTEVRNKSMKQYDVAAQNYPPGMAIDDIMESSLRDLILETEEKITGGALGYLDVKSRELWRKAIQNKGYDRQCKKLVWGSNISEDDTNIKAEPEPMDEEIKKEDEESRASTPSLDDAPPAVWPGFQDVPQRPVMFDMASAILQIAQGVEHKYLKRPLGLDQKERERGEMKIPTPAMERWEKALMESTTFPQLFLYLSTLENSVLWERSAINASCRICRRMKDPESMLLCDTCNKGHHMYCLKPKLTRIPAGDWHCPRCQRSKPSDKPPTLAKKRRLFSEDSEGEEENLEESICKVCEESGAQLQCGTCDSRLHLGCVVPPMRRVPKSKWFCHDCRNANSLQNTSTSNRKSAGTTEIKEEPEEVDIKWAVKQEQNTNSKSKRSDVSSKKVREREHKEKGAESPKINGYVNGIKRHDPAEDLVEERSSRRKCSKAATAKISQFAKQLRSNYWDADDENGDDEGDTSGSRSRRERRSTRRSEGRKGRDLPLDNAALQEILDVLMHDPDAPPFLRPVARSEAPDYHEIIKRPMDFGTIKHKLNMLSYSKNSDLIADAELLFDNCCLYNEEGSDVYRAGEKLRNLFYNLCKEHNLTIGDNEAVDGEPPVKKLRTVL
ncbi:unnamed protein product [Nezara viridula]|uniref:Bromodomain adjacent to zinc finger domain protein 1A n=1 Tax=Nezara viridula TaxID=85310 RepID=A0A9P0GXM8_NEZVI|nr:unnamed protein product [Nezara viridula]